jgi:hypothetical protein
MVTVLVALLLQQPVADLDTVNIANGQFFFCPANHRLEK